MDLDDRTYIEDIDGQHMSDWLLAFPDRFLSGWLSAQKADFNALNVNQIFITGSETVLIAAELFAAFIASNAKIKIFTWPYSYLPPVGEKEKDSSCLLFWEDDMLNPIFQQYEEQAKVSNIHVLTVGKEFAIKNKRNAMSFDIAVIIGYFWGLITRLEPSLKNGNDLDAVLNDLKNQAKQIGFDSKTTLNPAKRQAGQLLGRWVQVVGCDSFSAVAIYWKQQLNRVSKVWASSEAVSSLLSASIEGICFPETFLDKVIVLFLEAGCMSNESRQQILMLRQNYMVEGINTDVYQAKGKNYLSQMLTAIQFGDFMAYYLALANRIDPADIDRINQFNQEMG
jgi:glucose/mannose-6-phosphate isomerase